MAARRDRDASPKAKITTASPGSRRERASQSQVAIKSAARTLFARDGYLNVKITDILAEAGRSAGVFYDHFASKEQLLEALIEDFRQDADRRAESFVGQAVDITNREHLRERIAISWTTFRSHLPVMVAVIQVSMVDPSYAGRLSGMLETRRLADQLRTIEERGGRLPGPPELVASAISAMLVQFAYVWLATDGRAPGGIDHRAPDDDEAIDLLTDLVLTGIGGVPDASR